MTNPSTEPWEGPFVPSYADLSERSLDELIAKFDELRGSTVIGIDFVRQEIALKAQERQTGTMLRLTWFIAAMTLVVTLATLVNLVVAVSAWGGAP